MSYSIEPLESRVLFTSYPNIALEMQQWINQDRQTPVDAASRNNIDLNQDLTPNTILPDSKHQLIWSDGLAQQASDWADYNFSNNTLTHVGPFGSVPLDRSKQYDNSYIYDVENAGLVSVSSDDNFTVENASLQIENLFITSAGHRVQLMDDHTRSIGIAVKTGEWQGHFVDMVIVEMGTRTPILGDSNNDGIVNTSDFSILVQNFNKTGIISPLATDENDITWPWEQGDINSDGFTNTLDFNILASNYGKTVYNTMPTITTSISTLTENVNDVANITVLLGSTGDNVSTVHVAVNSGGSSTISIVGVVTVGTHSSDGNGGIVVTVSDQTNGFILQVKGIASGTDTLSFTNTFGYTNPPNLPITIAGATKALRNGNGSPIVVNNTFNNTNNTNFLNPDQLTGDGRGAKTFTITSEVKTPNQLADSGKQRVIPGVSITNLSYISSLNSQGIATIVTNPISLPTDLSIQEMDIRYTSSASNKIF